MEIGSYLVIKRFPVEEEVEIVFGADYAREHSARFGEQTRVHSSRVGNELVKISANKFLVAQRKRIPRIKISFFFQGGGGGGGGGGEEGRGTRESKTKKTQKIKSIFEIEFCCHIANLSIA